MATRNAQIAPLPLASGNGHVSTIPDIHSQAASNKWYQKFLPHGVPRVMAAQDAKAQGIFIPNWWLAILLIPVLVGVLWFFKGISDIQADQRASVQLQTANIAAQTQALQSLKDTLEYRLKNIERQGLLNDEHARQLETRIARIEGKKGVLPIPEGQ